LNFTENVFDKDLAIATNKITLASSLVAFVLERSFI